MLLAALGIAAGRQQVAVAERRNPHLGPRGRDREAADPGQRRRVPERPSVGAAIAEALAGAPRVMPGPRPRRSAAPARAAPRARPQHWSRAPVPVLPDRLALAHRPRLAGRPCSGWWRGSARARVAQGQAHEAAEPRRVRDHAARRSSRRARAARRRRWWRLSTRTDGGNSFVRPASCDGGRAGSFVPDRSVAGDGSFVRSRRGGVGSFVSRWASAGGSSFVSFCLHGTSSGGEVVAPASPAPGRARCGPRGAELGRVEQSGRPRRRSASSSAARRQSRSRRPR